MMCTGLAAPSRIPPTVIPPPTVTRSALYVMFAASTFGMISRLASVVRRESGNSMSRIVVDRAASRAHFSLDREAGRLGEDDRQSIAHFLRGGCVRTSEARVRQQRNARLQAEALHFLGGEQRHLGDFIRIGVAVHVRVADEELPPGQDHHLHRRQRLHPFAQADDVADVRQVIGVETDRATQHRVRIATTDQHRADERRTAAHLFHRLAARDALAARQLVVLEPRVAMGGRSRMFTPSACRRVRGRTRGCGCAQP